MQQEDAKYFHNFVVIWNQEAIEKQFLGNKYLQNNLKQKAELTINSLLFLIWQQKIEDAQIQLFKIEIRQTELEHERDLNLKMRENETSKRRELAHQRDELLKEVEGKETLYNMRIQRKIKEKGSKEMKELHLASANVKKHMDTLNV